MVLFSKAHCIVPKCDDCIDSDSDVSKLKAEGELGSHGQQMPQSLYVLMDSCKQEVLSNVRAV